MKTTGRLLAIAIVAVVAVMFTIGNAAAEEPQSCKDLKDKVCKICGEDSDGCKAIQKETDTEENCTTAIGLIDELDKTLKDLDEPTQKMAWDEFCKALAEE